MSGYIGTVAFCGLTTTLATLLGWLLLLLAAIDFRSYLLPNHLVGMLAFGAIADVALFYELSVTARLLAALAGGGSFWAIAAFYKHLRGQSGLGFGDVKFIAASGLWLGPVALPFMIALAGTFGILHALVLSRKYKVTRTTPIPLGTWMALSLWIVWVATRYDF